MQDYEAGLSLTETEQAEYDAWQEERDAQEQEHQAAWWAWVHDQERE